MKMRRIYAYLALAGLLALAACSGPAQPVSGAPLDFTAVCTKANDGKRVAVLGYLRLPDSYTGDNDILLNLYPTTDYAGTPIAVDMDIGTQANQVENVDDQYTYADLRVHLADNSVATDGTQVRVSGQVYFPLMSGNVNFTCGLQSPQVEAAQAP